MTRTKVIIIGGGIGGLATACLLAKSGHKVTLLEKNKQLGGRAGQLKAKGFTWDTGPSWFLMPDIFENFYNLLGENISKHLSLKKLSPSYRVFYKGTQESIDIYSDLNTDRKTFNRLERGAGTKLAEYLKFTEFQYRLAKNRVLYKNFDHLHDLFNATMFRYGRRMGVWRSMRSQVNKYFKDERLRKIMLYPLVFLGADPYSAPAVYSLLNWVDLGLGVYYPRGGIYQLSQSLAAIAKSHGASLKTNQTVKNLVIEAGNATEVELANGKTLTADIVISNAGVYHTERLLDPAYRTYNKQYWQKRTIAPSAMVIYLGIKGTVPNLAHHNLIFSKNWRRNFDEIFYNPAWPKDPSFYVSIPSKSDKTVAPKGHSNLFVMVPLSAELDYQPSDLINYAESILDQLEENLSLDDLKNRIVYKRVVAGHYFSEHFNSYKGSALGLAHTWDQTAVFRPRNYSKQVKNLYFVGADTHPGIGLPPALISAELVYKRLIGDKSVAPLQKI